MMQRCFLLGAGLALAAPAFAQDRPMLKPTRDVAVTYRISGTAAAEGPPGPLRILFGRGGSLMRFELPGGRVVVIVDRAAIAQRSFVVMLADRMAFQVSSTSDYPTHYGLPGAAARFTHQGSDTVADMACTNWQVEDLDTSATACITSDGLMLRTVGLRRGHPSQPVRDVGLEATQVTYGPQDAELFRVPPGYPITQMPGPTTGIHLPARR